MSTNPNIGWNAGAHSVKSVVGNAELTVEPNLTATDVYAGFSPARDVTSTSELTHAFRFSGGVVARFYESGVYKVNLGGLASGDLFSMRRIGGRVTAYKNGVLVYTSPRASFGAAFLAAAMYTAGDRLE